MTLSLLVARQDFTATFSDGEYAHKYYSGRRMWGAFRLFAPSAGLPPEYGNLKTDAPYPFALRVDAPVDVAAALAVLRDWYNGTEFSASDGLAAGPFGTPDRYSSNAEDWGVKGNWCVPTCCRGGWLPAGRASRLASALWYMCTYCVCVYVCVRLLGVGGWAKVLRCTCLWRNYPRWSAARPAPLADGSSGRVGVHGLPAGCV